MPNALACFIQATAGLAAQAVERGTLGEARRLLENALRAVESADVRPAGLRVVDGVGGAA